MDISKRGPIIKAVELSFNKWLAMKPKINGELTRKVTYGKGLTITRAFNTGNCSGVIEVVNFGGVNTKVSFEHIPGAGAKFISIIVTQWGEKKYKAGLEIPKGRRNVAVLERLKEELNKGFDRTTSTENILKGF